MAIGRNAPCPCGSGTKYKKCCLPAQERDAALRRTTTLPPATSPAWFVQDDGLDDLSNSIIPLVKARRFDDALGACRRLLDEFPEVVDGLERFAMVHATMGDHVTAAAFYRQALTFVTDPSRRHEYEGADFYQQQLDKEEKLAGLR